MNFTGTFFTISCLQAVDYLQDNAIITGKHCVFYVIQLHINLVFRLIRNINNLFLTNQIDEYKPAMH